MKKLLSCLFIACMLLSTLCIGVSAGTEMILPTENWTAGADGVFRIGSASDMLAFNAMAQSNNNYYGQTVILTTDIDMTGAEWTMMTSFKGTLDGLGHAIRNFTFGTSGETAMVKKLDSCTIQNLRMENANFTTTNSTAAVFGVSAGQNNSTVTFKNVYVEGNVACGNSSGKKRAAGFVGYLENNGTLLFENCVSNVTVTGFERCAGFVAQLANSNCTLKFTDCAFIGDLSQAGVYSAGFCGYVYNDIELVRCVSLGKSCTRTNSAAITYLDNFNLWSETGTDNRIVNVTDCYAAIDSGNVVGAHYEPSTPGQSRSYYYVLTINYDGQQVYTKTATSDTDSIYADIANVKSACSTIDSTLTKTNFATTCPALASAGWEISETETVTYAEGKTVALILPQGMAKLIAGQAITEYTPETSSEPETTNAPEISKEPETTNAPETTKEPESAKEPETTKEPEQTKAPAETKATENKTEEKSGCSSTVGMGFAVLMTLGCGVAIVRRKHE